jgi:hypothetical protein
VVLSSWRDAVVSSSSEAPFVLTNNDELSKRAGLPRSARFYFSAPYRVAGHDVGPRLHRWCWPARPDLGERWPSRLVATAAEDRLTFRRNPHTSFAAASDCRAIAIYEFTT